MFCCKMILQLIYRSEYLFVQSAKNNHLQHYWAVRLSSPWLQSINTVLFYSWHNETLFYSIFIQCIENILAPLSSKRIWQDSACRYCQHIMSIENSDHYYHLHLKRNKCLHEIIAIICTYCHSIQMGHLEIQEVKPKLSTCRVLQQLLMMETKHFKV